MVIVSSAAHAASGGDAECACGGHEEEQMENESLVRSGKIYVEFFGGFFVNLEVLCLRYELDMMRVVLGTMYDCRAESFLIFLDFFASPLPNILLTNII